MDSSAAGLLGFLMFMQLIFLLALLAGGLYALFALGRAAAGLDRLASAVEEWVRRQDSSMATDSSPNAPPNATQSTLSAPSPLPADSPKPNVSQTQSTPPQNSPPQSTPAAPANRSIESNESIL